MPAVMSWPRFLFTSSKYADIFVFDVICHVILSSALAID